MTMMTRFVTSMILTMATCIQTTGVWCKGAHTKIHAGYGVNFDAVGHVIVDGGSTFFPYTFIVEWPSVQEVKIPTFECDSAVDWERRCLALNQYIRSLNDDAVNMVWAMNNSLARAKNMLPVSPVESWENEEQQPEQQHDPLDAVERKKRSYHGIRKSTADDDLPDYLKPAPAKTTWSKIRDFMPATSLLEASSNLLGMPGKKANEAMKQRIRTVGRVAFENRENVLSFNSDSVAFESLETDKIDHVLSMGTRAREAIIQTQQSIINVYNKTGTVFEKQVKRLEHIQHIDDVFVGDVLPMIMDYRRALMQTSFSVKRFLRGVIQLSRGYLSPFIVSETDMKNLLTYVELAIERNSQYADLCLPAAEALSYYYNLKTVSYAHVSHNRSTSAVFVTFDVPLFKVGGLLPVYRIDTYAVPVTTGTTLQQSTTEESVKSKTAFTILKGLPDFIAVSQDYQSYVEMDRQFFLSCKGPAEAKSCGYGMNALRKPTVKDDSCAFALFTDDDEDVKRKCDFRYMDTDYWRPFGSALQMAEDSTFLMHASHRPIYYAGRRTGIVVSEEHEMDPFPRQMDDDVDSEDEWLMACPMSDQGSETQMQKLEVCDLCRIKIPCYCSINAKDFFLPTRYTGCVISDSLSHPLPPPTYTYQVNSIIIKSLFPQSDIAKISAFDSLLKKVEAPSDFPKIKFLVQDNYTQNSDYSDAQSASLTSTLERQKEKLPAYIVKEDAALARAQNMSDIVVDRGTSLSKAFWDLLGLFGGDVRSLVAAIFSPTFIILIAAVLSFFQFVPILVSDIVQFCDRK